MGNNTTEDDAADILWEHGVFDAHCHPTDTMSSVDDIPKMKIKVLTIMATRREDQDLVVEVARRFPLNQKDELETLSSTSVVPAFGWHPWFSYQLFDDRIVDEKPDAVTHYKNVLSPTPEDGAFLRALPEPTSLTQFLAETEKRLLEYPVALVGEIGLDRSFRLPEQWGPDEVECRDPSLTPGSRDGRKLSHYKVQPAHQEVVLEAQLRLAAKMKRAVSIHSVQAHGAVHSVLQRLWAGHEKLSSRQRKRRASALAAHFTEDRDDELEDFERPLPFPLRICMHSYSGPAEFIREFVHNKAPVDVYFSFSDAINFSLRSYEKVAEVIKAVPDSTILVESDLHYAGPDMDHRLGLIIQKVCSIKNWSIEEGIQILGQNWRRFIFGA